MGLFRDIIREHEKREVEKVEKLKTSKERWRTEEEKNIQKWEEYIRDILIPMLREAKADLHGFSYYSAISEYPPILSSYGKSHPGSIEFIVDMSKRSEVTFPFKAYLIFTRSSKNTITVSKIIKNVVVPGTHDIHYEDGARSVEHEIKEFIKKVYP
jgi:hypothetical protein